MIIKLVINSNLLHTDYLLDKLLLNESMMEFRKRNLNVCCAVQKAKTIKKYLFADKTGLCVNNNIKKFLVIRIIQFSFSAYKNKCRGDSGNSNNE